MLTIEQMIQREVLCCMSSLVSTLAMGNHAITTNTDMGKVLSGLAQQASELAAPVLDYGEAAIQASYKVETIGANDWQYTEPNGDVHGGFYSFDEACANAGIEQYEWEVYEHWAVSQWFAERLAAHGERIDTDFAGLNIWARTTTGQAISMDGVVQKIYAEMVKV